MKPPVHTVGVFDSGVGGLSVLRALLDELPQTRFIYVADRAYAPYGERTPGAVTDRSERIVDRLRADYPIDAMVVACNTATALAIDTLRHTHHDLPFVGVEPALKPATTLSRTRHIGVMATRGTLDSERYRRLQQRVEHSSPTHPPHFHNQPCDGLADAIEQGDTELTHRLCEHYVRALEQQAPADTPIDTLVLGCTHYPFATPFLRALCGPGVSLVDTGIPVARRTREVLQAHRPRALEPALERLTLLSTREPEALSAVSQRWLAIDMPAILWSC
ncbi:MAG: glutamate racemase [Hydrogenophaga sp.]